MTETQTNTDSSIQARISKIERELEEIRNRNLRVTEDKAWELSIARRAIVLLITYACACLLLWLMGNDSYWLNALIPSLGYLLSTLSLPWAKSHWQNSRR